MPEWRGREDQVIRCCLVVWFIDGVGSRSERRGVVIAWRLNLKKIMKNLEESFYVGRKTEEERCGRKEG